MKDSKINYTYGALLLYVELFVILIIGGCTKHCARGEHTDIAASVKIQKKQEYALNNETLGTIYFAGNVSRPNIECKYQGGLKSQSIAVVEYIETIVSYIENRLGIKNQIRVELYLIRVDVIPESVSINLRKKRRELPVPLFVEANNETWETIISQNSFFLYGLVHEILELSISLRNGDVIILLDTMSNGKKQLHYTRWFRDGLATYAEYLVYKLRSPVKNYIEVEEIPRRPLSSLKIIGSDLFSWHAFSNSNEKSDYYSASLGLFLLIESRFGESTIKEIIQQLKSKDTWDGLALIKLCNEITGIDIKNMVETFYFPDLCLDMISLTPAESKNRGFDLEYGVLVTDNKNCEFTQISGLRKNDVIIKIDGHSIYSVLDFEVSIFESMKNGFADIVFVRKGIQDHTTIEWKER